MRKIIKLGRRVTTFLNYLYYSVIRGNYTDYYAFLMNQRMLEDPNWGDDWNRDLQLSFLKKSGLKTNSTLLDFGCGPLSAGVHMIRYLDATNYIGIDISSKVIETARKRINDDNLADKRPKLILSKNSELEELEDVNIDFVIAQSVFTHMPMSQISKFLKNIAPKLKENGKIFATYVQHVEDGSFSAGWFFKNNFQYTNDTMSEIAQRAGFNYRVVDDWDHPFQTDPKYGRDTMAEFVRLPGC